MPLCVFPVCRLESDCTAVLSSFRCCFCLTSKYCNVVLVKHSHGSMALNVPWADGPTWTLTHAWGCVALHEPRKVMRPMDHGPAAKVPTPLMPVVVDFEEEECETRTL